MKLVEPPRHTSFYESFSDLVFGTLCVFILIVMTLMVRLNAEVDRVVSPSRFQGGSDGTAIYSVAVRNGRDWHLVWIPAEHHENCGLMDPIATKKSQMFREMASEEYLSVAAGDLPMLAKGFAGQFEDFSNKAVWFYLQAYYMEKSLDGARLSGALETDRMEALLDQSDTIANDPELQESQANFHTWAQQWGLVRTNFWNNVDITSQSTPCIRFTTVEANGVRSVRVGDYEMSISKFCMLLRSVRPGKGFYLEYVANDGTPAEPPLWVMETILRTTGFDGRVLSDYAKARSEPGP